MRQVLRRLIRYGAYGSIVVGGGYAAAWILMDKFEENRLTNRLISVAQAADVANLNARPTQPLPTRQELLKSLKETKEFDVLVIGGGATGCGVALDSQTRGLHTALVELDDFSSGTSSRSTKLIHGGVRYLQSAIMKLDIEQYRMVKEALFERSNLLAVAPHLSNPLPIMLPVYKWWQVPYYWFGIKMYDVVAGKRCIKSSYYISKAKALELFPMLRKEDLCGALIYYDGQHNDSRMNLAVAISAIRHGAKCANHVAVTSLIKEPDPVSGKLIVRGAKVKDTLTGAEWTIRAKCVINATGPFTDTVRIMDNPDVKPICIPAQGTHIVLPGYYSPISTGLLDPATKDGRVIFFLPWERYTVAGTTDSPTVLTHHPAPTETEVSFILEEIRHYLSPDISVRRGDVLSAWAGLRPLVKDPNHADTASLARNHVIEVTDSKMITIGGGKWTTYRHMAEETVDKAVEVCGLKPLRECVTAGLLLEGGHDWHPLMYIHLVQDYGLEVEVAEHLARSYGDRAFSVAKLAKLTGKRWPLMGVRLHEEFPYLEAEILYGIREYACTAVDVIGRRLRLAFLNTYAAEESLPKIVELMAKELGWDRTEKERQMKMAMEFIDIEMGKLAREHALEAGPIALTKDEKNAAMKRFNELDSDSKGHVTINDLRRYFKTRGEKIDERLLHDLLNEVDLNRNGQVDLAEFLQVWSGLKHGTVTQSRFGKYIAKELTVRTAERSGGGL